MGGAEFRKELPHRMEGELGEHHAEALRRGSAALQAERIGTEELSRQAGDSGVDRGAAEDEDQAQYDNAGSGIQTPEANGKREVTPNRTRS